MAKLIQPKPIAGKVMYSHHPKTTAVAEYYDKQQEEEKHTVAVFFKQPAVAEQHDEQKEEKKQTVSFHMFAEFLSFAFSAQ